MCSSHNNYELQYHASQQSFSFTFKVKEVATHIQGMHTGDNTYQIVISQKGNLNGFNFSGTYSIDGWSSEATTPVYVALMALGVDEDLAWTLIRKVHAAIVFITPINLEELQDNDS